MNLKNGHILLIWTMSWFQLLYDVSFFNAVIRVGNDPIYFVANVAQEIGGISGSLTSNFIAMISLYVVKNTKSIDVYKYYLYILAVVLFPSLVDVILYSMSQFPQYKNLDYVSRMGLYYFARLASIAINFILSFQTAMQISRISNKTGTGQRTVHEKAIRTLSMRLIYYPVVQAISRSGCAWYEWKYGFDFDPKSADENRFIAQCFMALLTPSASIGYMVIFLLMQPHAYECLKATLTCQPYIPRTNPATVPHRVAVHAPLIRVTSFSNFQSHNSAYNLVPSVAGTDTAYAEDQSEYTSAQHSAQSSMNYSFANKEDDELWLLIGNHDPYQPGLRDRGEQQYDYSLSQKLLFGHD